MRAYKTTRPWLHSRPAVHDPARRFASLWSPGVVRRPLARLRLPPPLPCSPPASPPPSPMSAPSMSSSLPLPLPLPMLHSLMPDPHASSLPRRARAAAHTYTHCLTHILYLQSTAGHSDMCTEGAPNHLGLYLSLALHTHTVTSTATNRLHLPLRAMLPAITRAAQAQSPLVVLLAFGRKV